MKICFVSDLHVDLMNQRYITWPEADLLLVAGDTANSIGDTIKFLSKVSKLGIYRDILFLDGNHEHYSNAKKSPLASVRPIEQTLDRLNELKPEGSTFLPRERAVKIGKFYFIGRCGWYSLDSAGDPAHNRARWFEGVDSGGTNDNKWIGFSRLTGEQPLPWELAEQHAKEIDEIITETVEADPEARFIVATHMAPCRETLSDSVKHLLSNPFYCNLNMTSVMERHGERIEAWHHGHTHERRDRYVNGVYVIVNPRGHPGENPSWEPVVLDL